VRILFDQGTPVPLRKALIGHEVETTYELAWGELTNGELRATAEAAGFDLLVTTDQNLRYQQNLMQRTIVIIVLRSTSWPKIKRNIDSIVHPVELASSGT
jgi:hypothetical protein